MPAAKISNRFLLGKPDAARERNLEERIVRGEWSPYLRFREGCQA